MFSLSRLRKFLSSKRGSFAVYVEPLGECFFGIFMWVFYNDIVTNTLQAAAVTYGVNADVFSTFNSIWDAIPAVIIFATVLRIFSLGSRREAFATTQ